MHFLTGGVDTAAGTREGAQAVNRRRAFQNSRASERFAGMVMPHTTDHDDLNDEQPLLDATVVSDPNGAYHFTPPGDESDEDDEAYHAEQDGYSFGDDEPDDDGASDSQYEAPALEERPNSLPAPRLALVERIRAASGGAREPAATGFEGGTSTEASSFSPLDSSPLAQRDHSPTPVAHPSSATASSVAASVPPVLTGLLGYLGNTPAWQAKLASIDATSAMVHVTEYDDQRSATGTDWRAMPLSAFEPDLFAAVTDAASSPFIEITFEQNSGTAAQVALRNPNRATLAAHQDAMYPRDQVLAGAAPATATPHTVAGPSLGPVQPQQPSLQGVSGNASSTPAGIPAENAIAQMLTVMHRATLEAQAENRRANQAMIEAITGLARQPVAQAPAVAPDPGADELTRLSREAFNTFLRGIFGNVGNAVGSIGRSAPSVVEQADALVQVLSSVGDVQKKLSTLIPQQAQDEGMSLSDWLEVGKLLKDFRSGQPPVAPSTPHPSATVIAAPPTTSTPSDRLLSRIAVESGGAA